LARGFRSPNIPELTQNGIHGGRYERGAPNLDAQSNYQLDFAYHLHTTWATFNIAPFFNSVNNYIYWLVTVIMAGSKKAVTCMKIKDEKISSYLN
jgi:iron complex outermembrane receptor protein